MGNPVVGKKLKFQHPSKMHQRILIPTALAPVLETFPAPRRSPAGRSRPPWGPASEQARGKMTDGDCKEITENR